MDSETWVFISVIVTIPLTALLGYVASKDPPLGPKQD